MVELSSGDDLLRGKSMLKRRAESVAFTGLVKYDAMRHAAAACHTVDEAKVIRDKMAALAVYARQAKDREMWLQCAEIKLRAERKAGELLADTVRPGNFKLSSRGDNSKLPADVSRNESSNWQKLAAVPESTFEKIVEEVKPGFPFSKWTTN